MTVGSTALNDYEQWFLKGMWEAKTLFIMNIKMFFVFIYLFLLDDIYTDCARAMVAKTVGASAWIEE